MKKSSLLFILLLSLLFFNTLTEAAGERSSTGRRRVGGATPAPEDTATQAAKPRTQDTAKTPDNAQTSQSQTGKTTTTSTATDSSKTSPALAASANVAVVLSDDELSDLERAYKEKMNQKQYMDAYDILQKIPDKQLDKRKKAEKASLTVFRQIEEDITKNTNPLFQKEEELDEDTRKSIQKLYREAQAAYLQGNTDLTRDLLIQILYLHRPNVKAKKFLLTGLNLKSEDYKVEDIKQKYWDKSKTLFYGGNYMQSAEALNVLIFFDKENPLVYERLGSSYYMMGEKKKAIEAWNTALFFNPGNKDLEGTIERAKKVMAEEDAEAKKQQAVKKTTTSKEKVGETQMMGLFKTQTEAYNFAGELKKRNLSPIVEEQDNGKWAVKVPKNQLQK